MKHQSEDMNLIVSFDERQNNQTVFSLVKSWWCFGEWEKIINLDLSKLMDEPDADTICAIVAVAYFQLGRLDKCKNVLIKAKELGCPQILINQLLTGSLYNSIARMKCLIGDIESAKIDFEKSVAIGINNSWAELVSQSRAVKEMASLGLLVESAKLFEHTYLEIKEKPHLTSNIFAKLKILETEAELINHELSLAQQKHQLYQVNDNSLSGILDLSNLKQRSPSQLGQDLWVLEKTNYKTNGYFVEFGATDGILLSNTYLLEKEFGWTGLCAEPNPKFYEKLKNNRSCVASNQCISGHSGDSVKFILGDEYGGIEEHAVKGMHKEKVEAYKNDGREIELVTQSLNDFLEENDAPFDIDYISIDTEGSEYEILKEFSFDKWNVSLFTIEHNFEENREKIRNLMNDNGYSVIDCQWDDWFFKD